MTEKPSHAEVVIQVFILYLFTFVHFLKDNSGVDKQEVGLKSLIRN